MIDINANIVKHKILVDMISSLLRGHGPVIQGSVLADLLAYWLACHEPAQRETLLALHIEHVRQLVPHNAKEISVDQE
jgi:hypothetical protein